MFERKRQPVDEAELDQLRDVYASLGMGFPAQALRLFGAEEKSGPRGWCLRHLGRTVRCIKSPDLSNTELFALPARWEVIRVVAKGLAGRHNKRGDQITVYGEMYCRPRGTWEKIAIPFQHVWTLRAGRVLLFENLVDATILRPEDGKAAFGV